MAAVKKRHSGQFKKGNTGRPAGTPNKLTQTVKETVLKVFNNLQEDPKQNLAAFAKKYPRDFHNIAARLIPTELQTHFDKVTIEIVRFDDDTITPTQVTPQAETGSTAGEAV